MGKKTGNDLIKNYQATEAFVQIDYLDGYSYIDKAGEIINKIVRDKKEIPQFNMQLNGLTITDFDELIPEIKISSNRLWLHFVNPKNLGNIHEKSEKIAKDIFEIINPTIFHRVGWRTYFARDNQSKKAEPLDKFKVTKGLTDFEVENLIVRKDYKSYELRLGISPVVKKADPTASATLFDVDLGIRQDESNSKKIIYADILSDIHNELKSSDLLAPFEEVGKE